MHLCLLLLESLGQVDNTPGFGIEKMAPGELNSASVALDSHNIRTSLVDLKWRQYSLLHPGKLNVQLDISPQFLGWHKGNSFNGLSCIL